MWKEVVCVYVCVYSLKKTAMILISYKFSCLYCVFVCVSVFFPVLILSVTVCAWFCVFQHHLDEGNKEWEKQLYCTKCCKSR